MNNMNEIRLANPTLAKKIEEQGQFLTMEQVKEIIKFNRMKLILVRCGNGRFLAPAQDVEWFCNIINKEGTDYVRDVSIPAG